VAPLPAADVVDIDGIAATSPARSVADVARTESFLAALVTVDSAFARRVPELQVWLGDDAGPSAGSTSCGERPESSARRTGG
jgi:hypothetical protein